MSNLRKFSKNFSSTENYKKYLEKAKWRAGPVLYRPNFNKINDLIKNVARETRKPRNTEQLSKNLRSFNSFFKSRFNENATENRARVLNKMSNKYGVNYQHLMNMYLHNRAHYLEKRTGASTLNKYKLMERVRKLNLPNNNSVNWITYVKRNNKWRRASNHNSPPPKVNWVSKRLVNTFPNLRQYEIPEPNGMFNDIIRTYGGIWVGSNANLKRLFESPIFKEHMRSAQALRREEIFLRGIKPKLSRTRMRLKASKIPGLIATRNVAACLSNNQNLIRLCAMRGGAPGGSKNITPNMVKAMEALINPNSSLKRKLPRTETETNNNKAAKKAKANENARQAAINAQLKEVANVAKRLRLNFLAEQMRRTPPAGKTWTRNSSGKVHMINATTMRNRKANLERYLKLYNNFISTTYSNAAMSRILRLAKNLRLKLGIEKNHTYESFPGNAVNIAREELQKIQQFLNYYASKKPK
jgi:hypothetical protein